jgi:hypothetical protein
MKRNDQYAPNFKFILNIYLHSSKNKKNFTIGEGG